MSSKNVWWHVTDLCFFAQMSIMVEQQSDMIDNIETTAGTVEKDMEAGYAMHPSQLFTISNVYAPGLATRIRPLSLLVPQGKSGGSASSLHSSSLPSSPSLSRLLLLTTQRRLHRQVARRYVCCMLCLVYLSRDYDFFSPLISSDMFPLFARRQWRHATPLDWTDTTSQIAY